MTLRRAGLPFRRVDIAQRRCEPRHPEFLELNPMGQVPVVLSETSDVLSESGAIRDYFAKDTALWPKDILSQTTRRGLWTISRWLGL